MINNPRRGQRKGGLLSLVELPSWFGEISLLELLERQPHSWRDFARLMSHKLRLAFIALEEMSLLPAAPRLALRLLLMGLELRRAGNPPGPGVAGADAGDRPADH